jgi:quercetin dioxygenase-like cupin family protein
MDNKIQLVKAEHKQNGSKKGINSRPIFDTQTDHVGEVRISGGTIGGWHSHGSRTMYGYVVSGKVNLEYGQNGKETAEMSAGDFFLIPPQTVHRDVNPTNDEAVLLIFNIGEGPTSVEASSSG